LTWCACQPSSWRFMSFCLLSFSPSQIRSKAWSIEFYHTQHTNMGYILLSFFKRKIWSIHLLILVPTLHTWSITYVGNSSFNTWAIDAFCCALFGYLIIPWGGEFSLSVKYLLLHIMCSIVHDLAFLSCCIVCIDHDLGRD
jgi:hypothetical protein